MTWKRIWVSDHFAPDDNGFLQNFSRCKRCDAPAGWPCREWGEDLVGKVHNDRAVKWPLPWREHVLYPPWKWRGDHFAPAPGAIK